MELLVEVYFSPVPVDAYFSAKLGIHFIFQFYGHICVTDVNECEVLDPCHENSECKNIQGGYFCKCLDGKTLLFLYFTFPVAMGFQ